MLIALDKSGQVINLLCLKTSEVADLKTQYLLCPACQQRVYLKQGKIRMPHFAHVTLLSCAYNSENESFQHLSLKKPSFIGLLRQRMSRLNSFYLNCSKFLIY